MSFWKHTYLEIRYPNTQWLGQSHLKFMIFGYDLV